MGSLRLLVYINHIHPSERTGQASFERELTAAMKRKVEADPGSRMILFTVRQPGEPDSSNESTVVLPLDKRSMSSYLVLQWRLFGRLFGLLLRHRNDRVTLYARYNMAMIAVLLASVLFGRRLVFRTGPALQTLGLYRGETRAWMHLLARASLTFFGWKAHRIIMITHTLRHWLSRSIPLAGRKVQVVPNGANPEKVRPVARDRRRWGLPERGPVLGFVGVLFRGQGVQTAVQAMIELRRRGARLPHLLVVGDGPHAAALREMAERGGVGGHVVWAGSQPHDAIPSAISAADVMLMPNTAEANRLRGCSAIKLFEYLACDRFVLASGCDDLRFLQERGVGRLVPPDSAADWASAIEEVLRDGKSLAGRGRAVVVNEYNFDTVAARIWSACFERAMPAAER